MALLHLEICSSRAAILKGPSWRVNSFPHLVSMSLIPFPAHDALKQVFSYQPPVKPGLLDFSRGLAY